MEGRVLEHIDFSWDIRFDVKTVKQDGYYSVEFKIPFSSLKFPEDQLIKLIFIEQTMCILNSIHGLTFLKVKMDLIFLILVI